MDYKWSTDLQSQSKWLGSVFKLWSYWFVYANNSFNWWNFIYHKYIQTFSCTFSGLDIRTVIQTFGTNTQQSCSLQSDTPHHVFFLMFVFCWELWHKYMQNSSVIAINAIKWFVKPLTSIQKFFFKKIPKLKSYVQFFQFSDTFTERLVRHRWTRPHTEADALQNTSVSRKSDIHSWSVSQTPFVFTSTFKKPIRHRWCSGLGRETAPSASNEGQRTLRKKVKGHG